MQLADSLYKNLNIERMIFLPSMNYFEENNTLFGSFLLLSCASFPVEVFFPINVANICEDLLSSRESRQNVD